MRAPPPKRAGVGRSGLALAEIREARLGERDQRVMIDLAGRDESQALGMIMAGPPCVQIIDGDRRDARLVAEDRAAERLIGKGGHPQFVEDDVARRVARLAQLLQHDLFLAQPDRPP